jgi:TetR/AcrR family transcriptional repressor of bet genes
MPKLVDHDRRRHELAMVSASLVADRGVGALTVRGLARAAGVSTGVVSHYFRNSEDMLFAAYQTAYRSSGDRFLRDLHGDVTLIGLLTALENTLPVNKEGLAEWKVRIAFWGLSDFGDAIREFEEQSSAAFRQMLVLALQARNFEDNPAALADHLEALISGLAIQHLMSPQSHPKESILARLREQFYQGVNRESESRGLAAATETTAGTQSGGPGDGRQREDRPATQSQPSDRKGEIDGFI